MNEQYLLVLGCTVHSTLDEIKAAHRRLSIKHHPDITGSKDSSSFRHVQEAYDFLKKNHRPQIKPRDTKGKPKYYRIFPQGDSHLMTTLPFRVIEEDSVIVCMWGMTEFNVHLDKGTEIPVTIEIKNIRSWSVPMTITFDDDF